MSANQHGPFNSHSLQGIATDSTNWNSMNGVTGVLVFNYRRFCQTLEGGVESVDELLARLRHDPRHHDILVITDAPVPNRIFSSWHMRAFAVEAESDSRFDRRGRLHLARVDPHRWFWGT